MNRHQKRAAASTKGKKTMNANELPPSSQLDMKIQQVENEKATLKAQITDLESTLTQKKDRLFMISGASVAFQECREMLAPTAVPPMEEINGTITDDPAGTPAKVPVEDIAKTT